MSDLYTGPERRREINLSEHQMDLIADRVVDKLYARAGKGLLAKIGTLLMIALVGVLAWLGGSGRLPG